MNSSKVLYLPFISVYCASVTLTYLQIYLTISSPRIVAIVQIGQHSFGIFSSKSYSSFANFFDDIFIIFHFISYFLIPLRVYQLVLITFLFVFGNVYSNFICSSRYLMTAFPYNCLGYLLDDPAEYMSIFTFTHSTSLMLISYPLSTHPQTSQINYLNYCLLQNHFLLSYKPSILLINFSF